jgi:H+/Cl- antiporter ClcA/PII-like signaling protein
MGRPFNFRDHAEAMGQMARWTLLAIPVGIMVGSASAFFLWSLDQVTALRWAHPRLLYFLPAGGFLIWLLYQGLGKSVEGGNNLILDRIHEPGGGVPVRMAPLILIGTLLTHLFGGSAGREGTAVQMGGSLASGFGRLLRLGSDNARLLLMAGVAAGFGSVFGTPLTGAIFAMEVLIIGRIEYQALIPVLVASVTGDQVCSAWGIHHTNYSLVIDAGSGAHAAVEPGLVPKIVMAAVCFGLASLLFAELTHGLQHAWKRLVPLPYLRPMLGAVVIIGLVFALGSRDYLGLGVRSPSSSAVTVLSAFAPGGPGAWSWWWKLVFTAVTLSCGFKGGEVTPLFFIGATLGHALAVLFNAPVDLFAGLGFIGVFAAATNTPVACTIMGIELFGAHYSTYFAIACFVAYFISGHSGIYQSQRVGVPKRARLEMPPEMSLREAREWQGSLEGMSFARFTDHWRPAKRFPQSQIRESKTYMSALNNEHSLASREGGKLRIYLKPQDRLPARGFWGRLNSRPVYRELIHAARQDGIPTAVAYLTHYGYTANGKVEGPKPEILNPHLTLCVELIGDKEALKSFCHRHGAWLEGKTVIFKTVEHWEVSVLRDVNLEKRVRDEVGGNREQLVSV